jgi:hypothetical protein
MRRTATALITATLLTAATITGFNGSAAASALPAALKSAPALTNLAHLDFLSDRVPVANTPSHSTYRLGQDPKIGVVWVYANAQSGGAFARVGGGGLNAASGYWGQGAYDTDDITRAAVVYLRQWQATGDRHAKEQAYQLLRGAAYFQTLTGPKAGEVVLWMQPDGTLNPTPTRPDAPNPSDSDQSYWLARTLWAYGEGYAAFRHSDPAFAAFLADRIQLTLTALNRDTLVKYGKYQVIHGIKVPTWLIVDGADASSEAMLGLSAYVSAKGPGGAAATAALAKLSRGVAQMSAGSTTTWPYRALLPWALSRSDWHAWGSQMATGLAAASQALKSPALLQPAIGDTAGFTAQLLTSTGPDNGLLPAPGDPTQIAYGADARVQALNSVGQASGRRGISDLAGIAAGWYFGANPSGKPVYDPATGVTNDGVQGDGTVNPNSGAESTIHGLLSMQVLDAHPGLAQLAYASAHISVRDGLTVVEAETGTLHGDASIVTPDPAWTGESLWSGQAVQVGPGSTVTWQLPASNQPRLVQPVVELTPGSPTRTTFSADRYRLGTVNFADVGRQGNAPSPTELIPVALPRRAIGRAPVVTASTIGGTGRIDALLVMPQVATLAASGAGHGTAVLTSKSGYPAVRAVAVAGRGCASVDVYDRNGRDLGHYRACDGSVRVIVAPGGFSIIQR